jgi:uncharacterized protein
MSLISSFQWESAAAVPEAFFGAGAAERAIVPIDRAEPLMASGCDKDGATRDYLGPDVWIECNEQSGVAQIHDPRLFRPGLEAFCRALAEEAVEQFGAFRVEICLDSSLCRLEFSPGVFDRTEMARRLAAALHAATLLFRAQSKTRNHSRSKWLRLIAFAADTEMRPDPTQEERPQRLIFFKAQTTAIDPSELDNSNSAPRLADMVLAGGSLAMAVAGAVLPGIPALPFLVLAASRAARLSPELDRYLRRYSWCDSLLNHADSFEGLLSLERRSVVKMLLLTAAAGAAFALVHPPLPVVIGLEIGVMMAICIKEASRRGALEGVSLGTAS